MNKDLKQITGPALEKPGDAAAILTSLNIGSIFLLMRFIEFLTV